MSKRYKVTQYWSVNGYIKYSKTYGSKIWAYIVAWVVSGKAVPGPGHYYTTIEEVN